MGHQERQATIEVLRTAAAEGRLTPEEVAQRVDTALAARTFADLDAVVADLPVPPPSAGARQTVGFDVLQIGSDPDHRLHLSAGMSSHKQRGVWSVPPFLSLSAGMGSVKVDFLQAICPHEVVDIAVSGGIGSITIVIPQGWGANTVQVHKGIGTMKNKADAIAEPGRPTLILHGNAAVGSIIVRYPSWADRRRLRRSLRTPAATSPSISPAASGQPGQPSSGHPAYPQDAPPRDRPPNP